MSETKEIDANLLYNILLRETENDTVQEINPELYTLISNFVGKLKSEEYDGLESKVKTALLNMINDMTSLLLRIRLEKISQTKNIDYTNLLDVEKYILSSQEEMQERRKMILAGILNGKSKFLESIAKKHKTKSTVVRFLQEMDQIVGADLEKYGPFKAEDIATIPYENAQALIAKKVAIQVRIDD